MRPLSRHSHFYDLLDALAQPGCALCSLAARTRWRYLDSLAYENVNDPGVREKLRASLGFCNRHAWYFVERVREVFGAAIIYRDVLHAVQRRAAAASSPDPFAPTVPCLACVAERQATDDALQTLGEALAAPDFLTAFLASDGLCSPHLLRTLARVPPSARGKLWELSSSRESGELPDPRRERWRAVGAVGTFGVDELALAVDRPHAAPTAVPSGEPFVCAVCTAVRAELGQLASWEELDDGSGGLCNVHAWLTEAAAAELYQRQIAAFLAQARELVETPPESRVWQAVRGLGWARPVEEEAPFPLRCVGCVRQAAVETTLCAQGVGPLCLPHLRRALRLQGQPALVSARPTWHQLDRLLSEYVRKEDYRFRGEPRGIEQSSPRWAVALIAGAPGIR